jgi:hypothetical protein
MSSAAVGWHCHSAALLRWHCQPAGQQEYGSGASAHGRLLSRLLAEHCAPPHCSQGPSLMRSVGPPGHSEGASHTLLLRLSSSTRLPWAMYRQYGRVPTPPPPPPLLLVLPPSAVVALLVHTTAPRPSTSRTSPPGISVSLGASRTGEGPPADQSTLPAALSTNASWETAAPASQRSS